MGNVERNEAMVKRLRAIALKLYDTAGAIDVQRRATKSRLEAAMAHNFAESVRHAADDVATLVAEMEPAPTEGRDFGTCSVCRQEQGDTYHQHPCE